jgi:hypothetical protein
MFFGEPSTWAPRHQIFKPLQKVVDETAFLKRPRRGSMLKEEVWESADGEVVRYSLAYMNPNICGLDNGRVLGYDNSHDHHHRHFMGTIHGTRSQDKSRREASIRDHDDV